MALKILKISGIILASILGLAVVLSTLAFGAFRHYNSPPEQTADPALAGSGEPDQNGEAGVYFEVHNGESALSVGQRLEDAGIIRSRYLWRVLCRLDKSYIKTGAYRLELPATQTAIHALLVSGRQILYKVTIPEGVTLKKIALILREAGICDEDAFLAAAADREILDTYKIPGETMEGFLYPETYFFPVDYPAPLVVKTMADTFFKRIAGLSEADLSPEELFEKVTLASIVEREYRVDEEAAVMAGVFYNRLKIDMALESCATVEYVITEIQQKPHPEVLLFVDLEIDNPYNTYRNAGLPPGPISAPGEVALNAVFHPVERDYFYFRLVDGNAGRHHFSKTLGEHNRAGALYVKRSAL